MIARPNVVVLQATHKLHPVLPFDHDLTEYPETTPDQVLERVRDADIVITILLPIPPDVIRQCPKLKFIIAEATGMAWAEPEAYKGLDVVISNTPQASITAVSEHALGLYFSCRKRIVQCHNIVVNSDEWAANGTLQPRFPGVPPSLAQEVVGIVGYGHLGQAMERICKAVGMGRIIIADRKGSSARREGRTAFDQVMEQSTVIFVCCPLNKETRGLISKPDLQKMGKNAILINMARGGIVDEADLAEILKQDAIWSAATDVTELEPAVHGKSPLVPALGEPQIPNLIISPHISWFSAQTLENLHRLTIDGILGFMTGKPINVVVPSSKR